MSDKNKQSMLFDLEKRNGAIIKVIGVGGGGGNAVAHMYEQGIVGVDFAICNTDSQALENSPVPIKIHLGPSLTEGMGAGAIPEKGKQACIESIDEVRKFLETGTKMVFITAGMGGGTGTGAAPIIAKAAKEMGILTVAIVTLPFKFEGARRTKQALEGLAHLKKCVDSILVIANDKLRQYYGNLGLAEAFSKADDVLSTGAKGIAEIITKAGMINVDFQDVHTVMKDSGVAIMGHSAIAGENRAIEAVQEVLNSPLLEDSDIRGAKSILLNITSGTSEVTMDEITEITDYIQEEAGYGTFVIFGAGKDETLKDKLSITLIATGFEERRGVQPEIKEPQKIKVPLDDAFGIESDGPLIEPIDSDGKNAHRVELNLENTLKKVPYVSEDSLPSQTIDLDDDAPIRRASKEEQVRKEQLRNASKKLFDSPETIQEMENMPAYKRRKVELDEINDSSNGISRHSVSYDDTDTPIIERKNSFLHDNVD